MARTRSKFWNFVFLSALAFQAVMMLHDVAGPWIDESDFNGACWSQSAHNTLRAGLWTTKGVPSAFYFGPLPIPPGEYYTHHPAVLSLTLTGMFAVFGEHEWAARLLPILFSIVSTVLLFVLVRDAAGARAAAFAAVVFVSLPMELHYGRMVNFEPLELVWMFAGLISLRRWEQTRAPVWWFAVLVTFALIFWTAWLGYMFLLVLCLHYLITARKKNPRLAFFFIGISFASFLVFLAHIWWVQPDAVSDLVRAFWFRISGVQQAAKVAHAAKQTAWSLWLPRITGTLFSHIQPLAWALGAGGAAVVLRRGRANGPLWWLGSTALLFFVLNTFYVTAFRNASYIHDYASFYFIVPVALMAGVALDAFLGWCETRGGLPKTAGILATAAVCLLLGYTGKRGAEKLRGQFHLLEFGIREPPTLIPELGALIQKNFAEGTTVIANCFPYYGPHLPYYAQRVVYGGYAYGQDWNDEIASLRGPVGGVIWLGEPNIKDLLDKLPPGTREPHSVAGVRFLIWKPGPG